MSLCHCPAYSRPHDHEWTGDEPVPGDDIECEHEMVAPHPRLGDNWLRCKWCDHKEESEY